MCVFDARRKLLFWQVSEETQTAVIKALLETNFIDDQRYAIAFAKDKSTLERWGKTKIKQALRHRRISDTHIERALEEVSEHAETDNLHQILARKSEGLKPDMEGLEKRNKLIRFGLGRGYSLDQILPCLEEILGKQVF